MLIGGLNTLDKICGGLTTLGGGSAGPPDQAQLVAWYQASTLATAQNAAAISSPLTIGSVAAWYRADLGITTVAGCGHGMGRSIRDR